MSYCRGDPFFTYWSSSRSDEAKEKQAIQIDDAYYFYEEIDILIEILTRFKKDVDNHYEEIMEMKKEKENLEENSSFIKCQNIIFERQELWKKELLEIKMNPGLSDERKNEFEIFVGELLKELNFIDYKIDKLKKVGKFK